MFYITADKKTCITLRDFNNKFWCSQNCNHLVKLKCVYLYYTCLICLSCGQLLHN